MRIRHGRSVSSTGSAPTRFGARLRLFREAHGNSQGQLAEHLHRSTSFVSMLETGQRRPTVELISEVVAALQLSDADRQQLLEAAGFSTHDLDSAIDRVVEIIAEETPRDDLSLALIRSDLMATAAGWRDALGGARQLRSGEFASATQYYTELSERTTVTPTLRIFLKNRLVDALLRGGRLDTAELAIQQARRALDELPSNWAQTLRAETIATQAMVALRKGLYSLARTLIDQSREQYARYFRDPNSDDGLVAQGFGRSYKRLAQVELFQGEPEVALDHCATAEAYLSRAPASTTRNLWLRRIRELQGWAWAKLRDFPRAIALHQRMQQECADAGDDYGRIMNQLYVADDYRGMLEDRIEADISHRRDIYANAAIWRAHVRDVLLPVKANLDGAEQLYRASLREITDKQDLLMRGRCLRCLAVVLRFQGAFEAEASPTDSRADTLNPLENRMYVEAERHLFEALEIERAIGQWRRIPGIFEAMADLAWDRGVSSDALEYYRAAIRELDSWRLSATDPAALHLRDRIQGHLDALHDQARPRLASPSASPSWRSLSERLIDVVCSTITRLHVPLSARSDTDVEWLQIQAAVEKLEGSRLLAQDRLSTSLSPLLAAGYPAAAADLYLQRHEAFLANLDHSSRPSHDLCCRINMENGLRLLETRTLYYDQMRRAFELLDDTKSSYRLDAGLESLPLAFMVKDAHVLLELPPKLAFRLPEGHQREADAYRPLCFHIVDSKLASELTDIFQALVALAQNSVRLRETVPDWLGEQLHLDVNSDDLALASSM